MTVLAVECQEVRREFRSGSRGEIEDDLNDQESVAVVCRSIHESLLWRVTGGIERRVTIFALKSTWLLAYTQYTSGE